MIYYTRKSVLASFCILSMACSGAEPPDLTKQAEIEIPSSSPSKQEDQNKGPDDELRVVRFSSFEVPRTIASLELSSLVMPWSGENGSTHWVLAMTPSLEESLKKDGAEILPFEKPEQFSQWSEDRQLAWNYVAKSCMNESEAIFDAFFANARKGTAIPVSPSLTVTNASPYGSYYLPYRNTPTGPSGEYVSSFSARSAIWGGAVINGTALNGIQLPADFLGGYPWDATVSPYFVGDPANPLPLVYFDLGWKSSGTFQGRTHQGPKVSVHRMARA